ncbi:MAG: SDR family oxidoreductase [Clostridia bacterium]|nr:SDR family oxidoreductase [Clostridia bacterium]
MRRVALVTGAAKGIGAAIVKKLCEDGFSVAVNYNKSEQRALALCSELASEGFSVFSVKCDVSSSAEVKNMISLVEEKLGRIDVLVNNAGVSLWGLFDETNDEEWKNTLGINLTGTFNCCREVLPGMLRSKYGRIVNISSVWGQVGASCEAVYSASKAGVIGLTKALAKEYAPSGITVNCVSPGVINTDMMNRFSEEEKTAVCADIPMGRMGEAEEVANAVAFFASEKCSFITGQILGVNGGAV